VDIALIPNSDMNGCLTLAAQRYQRKANLSWTLDKKTEENYCIRAQNSISKKAWFTSPIAPLIRLDGETYSCQLQLPGLRIRGSIAVAFVVEFLTRQKFLKHIRE
jgi:hypothetical protein